ncbi:MAG: hypothetical protein GY754_19385 [bacterium]|nr:hypothetical protein [bacterium]
MTMKKLTNFVQITLKSLVIVSLFGLFFLLLTGCEEGLYQSSPALDGTFTINSSKSPSYTTDVTLNINIDGAYEMRFSNDNNIWSEWYDYTAAKEWVLTSGSGDKTVYGEFRRMHSLTAYPKTASITVMESGASFSVNSGATSTISGTVTLSVNTTTVVEMRFSNDGADWSEWEAYNASKSWDLTAGVGSKTVFAEFKDAHDTVTSYNDSITLADNSGATFVLNNGADNSFSKYVSFTSIVDGAVQMRFNHDGGRFWSEWKSYNGSVTNWELDSDSGVQTVYAQFKDAAGNIIQKNDSITVSSSCSVSILNGAGYLFSINTAPVTVNLNTPGAEQVRFSDDGSVWSEWEVYAASKSSLLETGSGSKTMYVQFMDAAGNVIEGNDSINVIDTGSFSFEIDDWNTRIPNPIPAFANTTLDWRVSLSVNATGATQMRFRNEPGSWSSWQGYSTSKTGWELYDYNTFEIKTTLVELKDPAGNVVQLSDDITYTFIDLGGHGIP